MSNLMNNVVAKELRAELSFEIESKESYIRVVGDDYTYFIHPSKARSNSFKLVVARCEDDEREILETASKYLANGNKVTVRKIGVSFKGLTIKAVIEIINELG